jgi:hypothetical protein
MIVTVVVIGAICATEGSLAHRDPRVWFLGGATSVITGILIGGVGQVVLTVGPILFVLAWRTTPHTHEQHLHELSVMARHRQHEKLAELALVLVAVLLPYATVSGYLASAQRTDTAQPTIVSTEQQTDYGSSYRSVGHLVTVVTYTFIANGQVHTSKARRTWSENQFSTAKVCYDPNDIDGSHSLELPEYTCGSFDLHPNS